MALTNESGAKGEAHDGDAKAEPFQPYVLLTAVRDEEEFIGRTIESVANQSVLPKKWLILSDGSTDRTDEIVRTYGARHKWIELIRMPLRNRRDHAGKAYCVNEGYRRLKETTFDAIGCLDGDIELERDCFEILLKQLASDSSLGLVGARMVEGGRSYDFRFSSAEHVSGACQFFRRECFEAVGGYAELNGGGIDVVAVVTARMKGWKTRTFEEKRYWHLRPMNGASYGGLRGKFKDGEKDYLLGSHPIWEVCRGAYQMTRSPRVVGGCLVLAGYVTAWLARKPRKMPTDLIRFRRDWQMGRLKTGMAAAWRRTGLAKDPDDRPAASRCR